jgi:GntR family transcriptional repressor for pyruvate dehydrogenase complex
MPDSELKQIRSVRLSDQAAHQIRELIVSGQFQPGGKLPSEAELSSTLDIGRSSVREALRSLQSQGLIEVRPGAGAFVADNPISFRAVGEALEWLLKRQESLAQILQVREVLEGLAAALLAEKITDSVIAELREIVRQQRELEWSETNVDQQSVLDIKFHQSVAKASGNFVVEEIDGAIVRSFSQSNRAVLYLSGKMEDSVNEHENIIKALASGDPVQAEKASRLHIARVRNSILGIPAVLPDVVEADHSSKDGSGPSAAER